MTENHKSKWAEKRTDESRMVEEILRLAGFEQVDAYRYNSASLRVRVIDKRFESVSREERDDLVEPVLATLPPSMQSGIVNLVLLAASEFHQAVNARGESLLNLGFEDPRPSML